MKLNHLDNIDKRCSNIDGCEHCPFYHYDLTKPSIRRVLCVRAHYTGKTFRQVIEEIKRIELSLKEIKK